MKNKGNTQEKVVPVHSTHRHNVHHLLAHQSLQCEGCHSILSGTLVATKTCSPLK